jgi:hypothetical protein
MVPWRPHPGPASSKRTKMLQSGHDSVGVGWDEEGLGVGWSEMGCSGVGRGGVSHGTRCSHPCNCRNETDIYTPNATPSNPRKHMNDTLTRWGFAFSRARCRCGAHRFIGSRGRRGRKKWSGCGRPARVACCVKRRITENKGINNQQLANPLVSHTHTHGAEGRTSTTKCGNKIRV